MICIRCGKQQAPIGKTHCRICASYKKYWSQNKYDLRKLKGLCIMCGKAEVKLFKTCFACRRKRSRILSREAIQI